MFGLKEAGLLGATVVLAGGVGYVVWVYASSSRERRSEKQPVEGIERLRKEGERKEGEEQVVAVAAAPVAAASSPKSSEVRRRNGGTRRRGRPRNRCFTLCSTLFLLVKFTLHCFAAM